eukprot:2354792-Rhodomonas_salina.1
MIHKASQSGQSESPRERRGSRALLVADGEGESKPTPPASWHRKFETSGCGEAGSHDVTVCRQDSGNNVRDDKHTWFDKGVCF